MIDSDDWHYWPPPLPRGKETNHRFCIKTLFIKQKKRMHHWNNISIKKDYVTALQCITKPVIVYNIVDRNFTSLHLRYTIFTSVFSFVLVQGNKNAHFGASKTRDVSGRWLFGPVLEGTGLDGEPSVCQLLYHLQWRFRNQATVSTSGWEGQF